MTYREAVLYVMKNLSGLNLGMPGLEAREITMYAANLCGGNVNRGDFAAIGAKEVPEGMEEALDELLVRRLRGEPLAYIIGEWDFYGLTLSLTPEVLIPRADTEIVVERALSLIDGVPIPRVLDLCCGSGAIGIAILNNRPDVSCVFADHSPGVLEICRMNIAAHALGDRAELVLLDALEPPEPQLGVFDFIVCNPPYVSADEMAALPVEVSEFEPRSALYGGVDGLNFFRAIANGYRCAISPGGGIIFECGAYQADEVEQILERNGYEKIARHLDLTGTPRAVSAYII